MAKKDWMTKLLAADGAVQDETNPHANVLNTSSPSANATFGNGWGLPRGYCTVIFGPPKEGKSLLCSDFISQVHATNKNDFVVKYNTEMRERIQVTAEFKKQWGIDPRRYVAYETNTAAGVFDHIEQEIAAMCDDGFPLAAILIDSVNGIVGRRRAVATSIDKTVIGDQAQTIQDGMKQILPVIRKHNIALIVTTQVRSEMDKIEGMRKVTQSRGQVVKMAASWGLKHTAEYFMYAEKNRNKDSRVDLLGEPFGTYSDGTSPFKIRVKMVDSSAGPIGRKGQFTVDIHRGVINVEEEVFVMSTDKGVIEVAGSSYSFGGQKWTGKAGMLKALREDKGIRDEVVKALRMLDMEGKFSAAVVEDEEAVEDETIVE